MHERAKYFICPGTIDERTNEDVVAGPEQRTSVWTTHLWMNDGIVPRGPGPMIARRIGEVTFIMIPLPRPFAMNERRSYYDVLHERWYHYE